MWLINDSEVEEWVDKEADNGFFTHCGHFPERWHMNQDDTSLSLRTSAPKQVNQQENQQTSRATQQTARNSILKPSVFCVSETCGCYPRLTGVNVHNSLYVRVVIFQTIYTMLYCINHWSFICVMSLLAFPPFFFFFHFCLSFWRKQCLCQHSVLNSAILLFDRYNSNPVFSLL